MLFKHVGGKERWHHMSWCDNQASCTLPVPPTHLSVPPKREQAEGLLCSCELSCNIWTIHGVLCEFFPGKGKVAVGLKARQPCNHSHDYPSTTPSLDATFPPLTCFCYATFCVNKWQLETPGQKTGRSPCPVSSMDKENGGQGIVLILSDILVVDFKFSPEVYCGFVLKFKCCSHQLCFVIAFAHQIS